MGKTVVLGASPNPVRFAYKTVKSLIRHNHEVVPIGIKTGKIGEVDIVVGKPKLQDVDTIALYLRPDKQGEYYDYLINLEPKRIIFNPGTINEELINLAEKNNIEPMIDCALVMLNSSRY